MNQLDTFVQEKPTGLLYHYTGAAGLLGIVQNRQLWATDYRHLNDRREYRVGPKLLEDRLNKTKMNTRERGEFNHLVSLIQEECFVLSFSEAGDQLSQWRAYCPGGNGYSLGFGQNNELFASAKQHSFNLIRCEYDPDRQRELCKYLIETFMEEIANNKKMSARSSGQFNTVQARWKFFASRYNWGLALALAISALKHTGFAEEKEWRLVSQYPKESCYGVSFRTGRFGITPYFELPFGETKVPATIEELIIGPTSNKKAARAAVDLFLLKSDTTVGRIRTSRTPLRH